MAKVTVMIFLLPPTFNMYLEINNLKNVSCKILLCMYGSGIHRKQVVQVVSEGYSEKLIFSVKRNFICSSLDPFVFQ